jgi:O-antigen ligase
VVHRLNQLVAAGLIALIVFTALAHGAVEPWSIAVFEFSIVFLILLWTTIVVIGKHFVLTVPPIAVPIFAFLGFGLIQSITWQSADGGVQSLSIDPAATRGAVITLGFLLAAHLIAANFFRSERRLRWLTHFLVIFGFSFALVGILQLVAGSEGYRLWIRPVQGGSGWLTGPFVNHVHFAGYMELLAPLPIALLISGGEKHVRILYGFAATIMATAIVLTASRGGIISLVGSLIFMTVLGFIWKNRVSVADERNKIHCTSRFRRKTRGLLAVSAILVLFLSATALGTLWLGSGGQVLERLIGDTGTTETFETSRGWIWKTTGTIIRSNLLFGVGLGAYGTAYPKYSDRNESLIVDRAHNDYLQILSDTGLIGGIIGLWFFITFAYNIFKIIGCADPFEGAVAIGSAGASVSLLVHSFFDFNLQIPATALLFLILNALLSQVVYSKIRSGDHSKRWIGNQTAVS